MILHLTDAEALALSQQSRVNESSGFDNDQIEALRGAKDKAALHNDKKYVKDEEKKG